MCNLLAHHHYTKIYCAHQYTYAICFPKLSIPFGGRKMKFCEKVKEARNKAGLKQDELAKAIGVSLRTITNYESGERYPKKREVYYKLADVLKVDVNYLLTEDEEFLIDAEKQYGKRGAKQAKELLAEVSGLFTGGDLADEDLDEMMKGIQEAYWIAKEKNRKYTPKKYRKD